jgi:mannosyl-3-phosphoglycerate phosphatase
LEKREETTLSVAPILHAMPENVPKLIVVTDLDGTLLDHHSYGFEPVRPLLGKLAELGIPVIANTSKTRSEWQQLAAEMDNHDAFVVENGSAIYLPDGECVVFGEKRGTILEILGEFRSRYRFEGYADWDVDGISEHTGLSREDAARSADREFSEPLIWRGTDLEKARFCEEISARGLNTLQGGRFLHVLGQTDKGKAVEYLRSLMPVKPTIIALGDCPNDIAMLRAADIGIVIATPTGRELDFKSDNQIIRSTLEGPEGWVETMTPLLESFFSD